MGPVSTLLRRAAAGFTAAALETLAAFLVVLDTGRAAVVFFLELRVRVGFFFDAVFLLDEALVVDFFLVTVFLESLLLADDLPALLTFFLLAAFLAAFLLAFFDAFFADVFLLDVFFRLVAFLAVFLAGFFFAAVFFEVVFFDVALRAAAGFLAVRLRDEVEPVFLETLFLAAAFFFGMRGISDSVQNKSAIIHRTRAAGSLISGR